MSTPLIDDELITFTFNSHLVGDEVEITVAFHDCIHKALISNRPIAQIQLNEVGHTWFVSKGLQIKHLLKK